MKFIIEDSPYSFMVDWSKENKVVDGFEEEYFPSCKESIEALMRLLTNLYPPEKIAECIADGLDIMDYSRERDEDEEEED